MLVVALLGPFVDVMLDVLFSLINDMVVFSLYFCMLYTYICCLLLNIFARYPFLDSFWPQKRGGAYIKGELPLTRDNLFDAHKKGEK